MRALTNLGHETTFGGRRAPAETLAQVAAVMTGGNWSTGLLSDGHRHLLSWEGSDYLALDIDGGMTLAEATARVQAAGLAHVIGPTQSHLKEKKGKGVAERFRVVLRLESRIADPAVWRATYRAVASRLGLPYDTQAADAVRWWRPCKSITAQAEGAAIVPEQPAQEPDQCSEERPPGQLAMRAEACRFLDTHPALAGGEEGDMFPVALKVVRGFGIPWPDAAEMIEQRLNVRCDPPWKAHEIRHKCQDAEERGRAEWGFMFYRGLAPDVLLRAFRRYGPPGSDGFLYRIHPDGRMVQITGRDAILVEILDVSRRADRQREPTTADLENAARWLRAHAPMEGDLPNPIGTRGDGLPALARIWPEPGPTPAWDEFLSRLEAPETFLGWLWMLTLPAPTRQVLWIQGPGNDGKSAVLVALRTVLGGIAGASVVISDEQMTGSGKWAGGDVFGKRLLMVDDTKHAALMRRGLVHLLSGGGVISAEKKGKDQFSSVANVNIVVTSNKWPEIGNNRADRTRLLPMELRAGTVISDYRWKDRLVPEFPALLERGRLAFERLSVGGGEPRLRVEPAVQARLDKAADVDGAEFDPVLERAGIVLDPAGTLSAAMLTERLAMRSGLNPGRDGVLWGHLKDWLVTEGCEQVRGPRPKRELVWKGIRLCDS